MVRGVFFSIIIDGTCLPAIRLGGRPVWSRHSWIFRASSHGLGSSFIIHHLSFII
jgi:hypothetical protein